MSEHSPDSADSPPSSPKQLLFEENAVLAGEEEVDPDLLSVDFSSDFTNRTDVIKAMATRWSKYVSKFPPSRASVVRNSCAFVTLF